MKKQPLQTALATAILWILIHGTVFAQNTVTATVTSRPNAANEQQYRLENSHFGDVLGHATFNPSTVDIHARGTAGKQDAWIIKEERRGVFKLYAAHNTALVLEAAASNNGTVLLARDRGSAAGTDNQRWQKVDQRNGTFKLRNLQFADKVLDASAGTRGRVQMWSDVGNSNQYVANAANQRWRQLAIPRVTTAGESASADRPRATATVTSTTAQPRATGTATVTVTQRPTSVSGINCATDPTSVLANLLSYLYNEKNNAEVNRLMDCTDCARVADVLEQSGIQRSLSRRASEDADIHYAIKKKLLNCKHIGFSRFTDDELNRYFADLAGSQFCEKVRAFTPDEYIVAVSVYFELKIGINEPNMAPGPAGDFLRTLFIPFPKINGFHDADEQTLLRILNCLPCADANAIINHFSYRVFDHKFDGAENTQFQQLYNRCNAERYAQWTDNDTRTYLMNSTCGQLNALDLHAVRDLVLNLFVGHTDAAEETAIIKLVDCLHAEKVQRLVNMQGTTVKDFKSEFQGRNSDILGASFSRKGVRY